MVPLRRLWSSSYPPNAFGLYDMYLRASQRPRIFMPTVMTVLFTISTEGPRSAVALAGIALAVIMAVYFPLGNDPQRSKMTPTLLFLNLTMVES